MDGRDPLYNAILKGDGKAAAALTADALKAGEAPLDIVNARMIPAMDEVGRRFEARECFVPELLFSGRAMKSAVAVLQPLLKQSEAEPAGTVLIATVQGDLHDIGKNLVALLLEGGGFRVHDLGVDVTPAKVVDAVKKLSPDIVALSALLTVTLPAMKTTVDALSRAEVRDHVRVIVGGAPVTRHYADEIGADGYSDNAFGAVRLARSLVMNGIVQ